MSMTFTSLTAILTAVWSQQQWAICGIASSEFNVIDSLAPGLGHAYQGMTLTGTQEQFFPNIYGIGIKVLIP